MLYQSAELEPVEHCQHTADGPLMIKTMHSLCILIPLNRVTHQSFFRLPGDPKRVWASDHRRKKILWFDFQNLFYFNIYLS